MDTGGVVDVRDVPPVLSALKAIKLLVGVCAGWSVLLGVSILATAGDRWPPDPRFETALKMPGAPESWGVFILVAGLLIAVGLWRHCRWTQIVGLLGSGVWCVSIAIAYGIDFWVHHAGDAGAPVGYAIAALFYLIIAVTHFPRLSSDDVA